LILIRSFPSIAFVAPIVQQKIGTKITFVWAGFLIGSAVFIFFCVPETAGLSIAEIDSLMLSGTPAWRSSSFRKDQHKEETLTHEKRRSATEHREGEKALESNATSARTSEEV
jgi:SP family sugar:H+ symporter-like MFS transporter